MGRGECGGLEGMGWKTLSPKGSDLPWRELDSMRLTCPCLPNPFLQEMSWEWGVYLLMEGGRVDGLLQGQGWPSGVVGDHAEKRGSQRARKEGC